MVAALRKYYPPQGDAQQALRSNDLESRYRALAPRACDIVDLANLPEIDDEAGIQYQPRSATLSPQTPPSAPRTNASISA